MTLLSFSLLSSRLARTVTFKQQFSSCLVRFMASINRIIRRPFLAHYTKKRKRVENERKGVKRSENK